MEVIQSHKHSSVTHISVIYRRTWPFIWATRKLLLGTNASLVHVHFN